MNHSSVEPAPAEPVNAEPAPDLRGIKLMVGVMGVMLILAAIGVVAAIIHKAKQKSLPNAGNVVVACQPQRVALPEGARILDSRVEDGKVIILHLGYVNGSEAWQRIDWCSGTVTADVTLGNGEKIVD